MLEQFKNICKGLFTPDDTLLLAVSGGVDSMVMLRLFMELDYSFAVAHCNFSLRGSESDGDTQYVTEFCKENNIKLHSIQFNTHKEMDESGDSLQMTARRLRYDWFSELCTEHQYTKVAIAHNSGDTIETFFINLIRGTGIKGLCGIPLKRDVFVRPLLSFSRSEIEQYAKNVSLKWREDSSNSKTAYLRNKLRIDILSELEKIEPQFASHMQGNMSRLSSANSFIEHCINEIRNKSFSLYRSRTTVALDLICKHPEAEFIMYELFSPMGFTATDTRAMLSAYRESKSAHFISSTHTAVLSHSLLVISERADNTTPEYVQQFSSLEGTAGGFTLELLKREEIESLKTPNNIAYFDASKVKLPLKVRYWQEGESFRPFGMKGKKKVSDLFVDAKVHIADKHRVKILTDASDEIMWVVSMRTAHNFSVTKATQTILKISYKEINE